VLTRDQIIAIYHAGPEAVIDLVIHLGQTIEQQQLEISVLKARLTELENHLATNSRNSNKPPSSDSFAKQTRSLRQPSGKPSGGQPGHPGTTLKQVAVPDGIITHAPAQCVSCGHALSEVPGRLAEERRQVFELPVLQLVVTEHRVVLKECPGCGQPNAGVFPEAVPTGASYGAGVKSFVTSLNQEHLVPSERSCQIFEDLFGQPIAEGTLHAAVTFCAAELVETEARIKQGLIRSEVVNCDETGMYVEAKREWLHSASTPQLTHYACHEKRGSAATQAIGILPEFKGRAIHDGFRAYWQYDCEHGLCNAHHLRELTFVHEQLQKQWAGQMKELLVEIKHTVDTAKEQQKTVLEPEQLTDYEQRYAALLQAGTEEEQGDAPPATGQRGPKKQSKSKNLLDRLEKYKEETLAFMTDFAVPFDNNLAERDLRMMKVKQKVSGCFRTIAGAQAFCRIRSYISTMKKQGHHVISALKSVFSGHPLVPDVPG
jgi:transposase